jgi:hypothetical protein
MFYMELHPCGCGRAELGYHSVLLPDGADLLRRYSGVCGGCGTEREFLFRVPRQPLSPPPSGEVRFGGDQASELVDAGQWWWLAERYAGSSPADSALIAPAELAQARTNLAYAVAAVDEVVKFIPPGVDSVPVSAFWTRRGRQEYQREPRRFARAPLDALRRTYRDLLARLPAPATAPSAASETAVAGTLSGGRVRALARRLVEVGPLLRKAPASQVAAVLGWCINPDQPYEGVLRADAGLAVGAGAAELNVDDDGAASELSVPICEIAKPRDVAGFARCQDAFALGARALVGEFGAPAAREPGRWPAVRWRLVEVMLSVRLSRVEAHLTVLLNRDFDEQVERARHEQ